MIHYLIFLYIESVYLLQQNNNLQLYFTKINHQSIIDFRINALNCSWIGDRIDLRNICVDFSLIDTYLLSELNVNISSLFNLHSELIYLPLIECYLLFEFVYSDIEVVNLIFIYIYFIRIKSYLLS